MKHLKPIFILGAMALTGFVYLTYPSHAMSHMGMGMGQGMMGGFRGAEPEIKGTVNSSHANELLNYIHVQNLPCLQCHTISNAGFGPSYASVSSKYAHVDNASDILSDHIVHGFGRMPAGLANDGQAKQLAKLILDLTENETKK